jgi:chromate reductase
MKQKRIAVLVGSLRKASFNRKMAKALISLAPEPQMLEIIEIGGLPLYDQDYDDEGRPPAAWTTFREHIKSFDGFLFVTPEYNRSVPAVLKNALDVGSRPYGKSIWGEKPGAVISVSPGAIGGFGANHHLRQSLVFLNVPTMQQPEAYIGNAANLFD